MSSTLAYQDAVDLLDADHKLAQNSSSTTKACARTAPRPKRASNWP